MNTIVSVQLVWLLLRASSQRPVLVLLQKAKKASREKQKAADAALRGNLQSGRRLADTKSEQSDVRHEAEQVKARSLLLVSRSLIAASTTSKLDLSRMRMRGRLHATSTIATSWLISRFN